MEKPITIAIDGPASSGKSTVAKLIAKEKQFIYIDTGAMYRAITLKALRNKVAIEDEAALVDLLLDTSISFEKMGDNQLTFLDGEDVTEAIRQSDVSNNVSVVSSHRGVREELVKRQREMAANHSVVMDGRDIGTVVLPAADLKIFLEASANERAMRRYKENQAKGIMTDFDTLLLEIKRRDEIDSTRKESPLKQADDAVAIDTTALSIDEVKQKILDLLKNKLK